MWEDGDGNMNNKVYVGDGEEEYGKRLLKKGSGIWGSGRNMVQWNLPGIYKDDLS